MNKPAEVGAGRLPELDFLSAIACLAVIMIHVLSPAVSQPVRTGATALAVYLPWRLMSFAVPAFIFSSALKLSASGMRGGYPAYLAGRFYKIFLPYVLWTTVYYLVFRIIGYVNGGVAEYLKYIALGNLSAHFYFIIIIMQFYILAPLWRRTVRSLPWYVRIAVSLTVMLLMYRLPTVLALAGIDFAYTDRLFPTYLFYWSLGLTVGASYPAVSESLIRHRKTTVPVSAAVAVALTLLAYLSYSGRLNVYDLDILKIISDSLSILLLLTLCIMLRDAPGFIRRLIGGIYKASFSVYLSHCLVLTLSDALFVRLGVTRLLYRLPLRFIAALTLPFALYYAGRATLSLIFKKR